MITTEILVMQKFLYLVRYSQLLIRSGLHRELLKNIWRKLFCKFIYINLTLEVGSFQNSISSRVALNERPIKKKDYVFLTSILLDRTLNRSERHEAARRIAMLKINLNTCYVVEDTKHNVRFLQWLVPASENEKLQKYYGDWYPKLAADEGLMESVYVFPKYRGTGILPCAVRNIVGVAFVSGIKRIVTLVPSWNINSLSSFMRMGFKPYQVRIERRCFGFHRRKTVLLTSTMDEQNIRKLLPYSIASMIFMAKE